jgi:putative SOS response-associated peptidase YedK
MCGRIAGDRDPEEVGWHYHARLDDLAKLAETGLPRFNIAPRSQILTLVRRDDERVLTATRWGLIPHWAKDRAMGDRAVNARGETVARLPTFRDAFKRSRCVIPATHFYEWQRQNGTKVPHAIKRVGGEPMSLAGLTSRWTDRDSGEILDTCTIITTKPNAVMEKLHNRMPVVLDDGAIDAWLEPDQDTAVLQSLLTPCPDDVLTAYAVSTAVNSRKNQGPELVEPV